MALTLDQSELPYLSVPCVLPYVHTITTHKLNNEPGSVLEPGIGSSKSFYVLQFCACTVCLYRSRHFRKSERIVGRGGILAKTNSIAIASRQSPVVRVIRTDDYASLVKSFAEASQNNGLVNSRASRIEDLRLVRLNLVHQKSNSF